jgi:hypothetical protein
MPRSSRATEDRSEAKGSGARKAPEDAERLTIAPQVTVTNPQRSCSPAEAHEADLVQYYLPWLTGRCVVRAGVRMSFATRTASARNSSIEAGTDLTAGLDRSRLPRVSLRTERGRGGTA